MVFSRVLCGLPLLLFPSISAKHVSPVCCPHYLSCFISMCSSIDSVSNSVLIVSFLILSILVTPLTRLK
ncbi:unnamed protein product [Acanthoscelides obtectus]|uniref:Secreted protein n=1 Tax=Acanthoscelides obtectus TaxID=200917 RepID=A0A9P0K1F7_ACAOB|nr:unnamed protein product [Acanthoscelides obtectus]CAK1657061.1 hypothetical protein AOBTE_LOCUS20096 [Acanthoscelides obtectus]